MWNVCKYSNMKCKSRRFDCAVEPGPHFLLANTMNMCVINIVNLKKRYIFVACVGGFEICLYSGEKYYLHSVDNSWDEFIFRKSSVLRSRDNKFSIIPGFKRYHFGFVHSHSLPVVFQRHSYFGTIFTVILWNDDHFRSASLQNFNLFTFAIQFNALIEFIWKLVGDNWLTQF